MKIQKAAIAAFLIGCLTVQGELYAPGAGIFLWGVNEYVIAGSSQPNGEAYDAGIWVETAPSTYLLTAYKGTAGVGHAWYSVSEDVVIDAAFATNTTPFYSIYDMYNFSQSIEMWPQPFMLAFWLDVNNTDVPDANDVFGWAEFTYDGVTLSLVDSAAENAGVGIVAGTYEVIPEPATILLFGIGGVGVWLLRRNSKHAPKLT